MDKRVATSLAIAMVLILATVALVIAGGGRLHQTAAASTGCVSCHEKLSTLLPEQHPKLTLDDVGSCLICHRTAGTAVAFEWVIHRDHYAAQDFKGDCWSCHVLQDGKFKLSGVDAGGVEATKEDVDRMTPYYQSWAKSEFEDHAHSQAAVVCSTCHGKPFPEPEAEVVMDQCIPCHGDYYGVLGDLTKQLKPNPHQVTHIGLLECAQCHFVHKEMQNYCSSCHASQ